jgi:phenylacetate-CoA ligase
MLRFDTVFKGINNIREAQIVQEELDLFVIKIVPGEKFSTDEIERLESNMRIHVGSGHIIIKPVDSIPRSPSGKFRAVICNLSEGQKKMVREASLNRSSKARP